MKFLNVVQYLSPQVKELAESVLRDPVFLTVGTNNAGSVDIDQRLVYVGREEGKLLAIRQLVQEGLRPPVLVFLQSKERAKVQLCTPFFCSCIRFRALVQAFCVVVCVCVCVCVCMCVCSFYIIRSLNVYSCSSGAVSRACVRWHQHGRHARQSNPGARCQVLFLK